MYAKTVCNIDVSDSGFLVRIILRFRNELTASKIFQRHPTNGTKQASYSDPKS